jgi:hypothetical protein
LQSRLERDPDIVIRFVDSLPVPSRIRYLGVDDAGFTDDAFLVLRGPHKSRARAQIPFDRVGKQCEIVCERGLLQVPLLIPILNLTVLGKGTLPLHASAFSYRDTGFVATGWSRSGKTEVLLGFMANGASYVGDEWIYLSDDGRRMHGIPEPIRVWNWHLDSLPQYRRVARGSELARLRFLESLVVGMERLSAGGSPRRSSTARLAGRVKALLGKQLYLDVSPYTLFGREACALTGVPEKVLFLSSHDKPEVTLLPVDPQEIARRMVFSLQEEQMSFTSSYWKYRFAFPEAANDLVESSRQIQSEILKQALEGKEAYEVLHPYPVRIPALFEKIERGCLRK